MTTEREDKTTKIGGYTVELVWNDYENSNYCHVSKDINGIRYNASLEGLDYGQNEFIDIGHEVSRTTIEKIKKWAEANGW